ncbi:MFS transporter [uncultured Propionibacterium sp.]|uniref:MFS transporter n=1 Tax=uncultured Propionibacterium sp. TaxID=218066 RepID=UPI002931AAB2|nr:MFS transporter [uncultured Propionibacterium sp.]
MTIPAGDQRLAAVDAAPFGMKDKIGYALGDAGNNFTFNLVNSFLTIFYTNVFGIKGAIVGVMFMIARFFDAFVDVVVGRLADNSGLTDRGRFTPWVIRMKYPLLVSAIILWVPLISGVPLGVRVGYAFVTYLAFGVLYSFVNIPYGSMASAISDDPEHKTALSTWRSVGAAVGSAVVSYVVPLVMYAGHSRQITGARFFFGAAVFAAIGTVCYVGLTALTTERVRVEKAGPVPFGRMLRDMAHNRALLVLVVVDLVVVINQNLSGTMLTYLYNDYFQDKGWMSVALVFNFTTVVLIAPFAGAVVRRFGRKESAVAALFFAAAVYGALFLVHTHSPVVYLVGLFFGSLGAGVFNLMVWAFITDVIDNHEVLTGDREDGVVYGVNSFARKFAQGIGGLVGGSMLSLIGYVESNTGGAQQSAEVVNRIYNLASGLPTACCLVAALVLLLFYLLGKRRAAGNAAAIEERHAANAARS